MNLIFPFSMVCAPTFAGAIAGSWYLLAPSDKLVELKTICFCGRKASMVLRLDQSGKPCRR